jgi:hypothetical protein
MYMTAPSVVAPARRPRFRRAEPPPFRLTDDDVAIVRQLARHRFLRSTHIAALTGRSLDRINDRLLRLYHAAYIDRPRAQLEAYPVGSGPMVYALADSGARLLIARDGVEFANVEWSRKNRNAGRPFIEHQLEIMDFYVSAVCAARARPGTQLIRPGELVATFPDRRIASRSPFKMRATLSHRGMKYEVGVIPDFAFGLAFQGGARRNFLVEIDRGTMPVKRSDPFRQTSFEEKMRAYLTAYAGRQHEAQFGWKTFRILTVTTDDRRLRSIMDALRALRVPHSPGALLFLCTPREQLRASDPLAIEWRDGNDRATSLYS